MKEHKLGIIMNGVTGRMETIMPEPVLVGRNKAKLENLCVLSGIHKYTTHLEEVLNDPAYQVYFDAQTTGRRAEAVKQAAAAGKHIYCEKPVATNTASALDLYEVCREAGVKHGVVMDKLWLPGLIK